MNNKSSDLLQRKKECNLGEKTLSMKNVGMKRR
jgi:hypothetical protein